MLRWRHRGTTPVGPLKEQLNYLLRAVPEDLLEKRALLRQPTLALLLEAATEAFERLPAEALDLGPSPMPSAALLTA